MLPDNTIDFTRVEVTVAFVDLAGYSVLTEACGDREAAWLAARLADLAHAALQPGVQVVKTIGDAVMLAASAPNQMMATMTVLADRVAGADGFLPIRAGIHHGPAIGRGGDYFGHAVNLAARITALAGAGDAVMTAAIVQRPATAPSMKPAACYARAARSSPSTSTRHPPPAPSSISICGSPSDPTPATCWAPAWQTRSPPTA
ncbi:MULTISPECIES: adenylate/guanylate cyclase domain-containing protein [Mycolicibacterium]|uniref:adenylate/guanylate cyclase domain-containing protein n=1 Tax=Mycolicibacterium TaxID=1866885 RepID=UPI001F3514C0|nr:MULTISPECIES: adenylate/guanylate cyclase domain-containing protein [Mycolicibacterium]